MREACDLMEGGRWMRAQAALPRAQKQDTDTGRSARAAARSTRWRISAVSAVSPRRLRQSNSPRRAHRFVRVDLRAGQCATEAEILAIDRFGLRRTALLQQQRAERVAD